ncbi:hypothetical protein [Microvirga vignae]|uniref:hypothetical protein n=1 Tax=Microvirga vignae TaxID=1225564 RepID=UPI000A5E194D|nr:hypothetical protein [Microvirga vignae]
MPDYEAFQRKEETDRARFEQLIAEGERRVTKQMLLIEQLRADGHDTAQAERFLAELRETLAEWHQTRADLTLVAQAYEVLEKVQGRPPESRT